MFAGTASHEDGPPLRFPINLGPPGSDGLPIQIPEPDEPGSVMPEVQSTRTHCVPGKQLPAFGCLAVPNEMRLWDPSGWWMPVPGAVLLKTELSQPEKKSPPGTEPVKSRRLKSLDVPVTRRFAPFVVGVPPGGESPVL